MRYTHSTFTGFFLKFPWKNDFPQSAVEAAWFYDPAFLDLLYREVAREGPKKYRRLALPII